MHFNLLHINAREIVETGEFQAKYFDLAMAIEILFSTHLDLRYFCER